MRTDVGIFTSRSAAASAIAELRRLGFADSALSLLMPETNDRVSAMPTTEAEPPGPAKAIGAVVGGAVGAAAGMPLGVAASSVLIPGIGPIIALGLAGAAVLAAAGAAVGSAFDDSMRGGVPKDEAFVYVDALRQGRSVVIVLTEDDAERDAARGALIRAGAETLDAAREQWWIGLQSAERERYVAEGHDFDADEPLFRAGFEAALRVHDPGRSFGDAQAELRDQYPNMSDREEFRRGYDRGVAYYLSVRDVQDRAA